MTSIARVGDRFACKDAIAVGSSDVFANNLPVARLGDATTGHGCNVPTKITVPVSANVFVNNIAVASLNYSMNFLHSCSGVGVPGRDHTTKVSSASSNVFVNGA